MSNTLSKVFIFAAGAAVGSLVTWKLVEKKYKQIADREINDILDRFGSDKEESVEKTEEETEEEEDEDKIKYTRIAKLCGYLKEENEMAIDRPYVISPEDYDDPDIGYNCLTLFYYNNGIVVDEGSNIIEGDELEELIGSESLTHFGEYEDDSVFVRNDAKRLDIEILKDEDDYEVR